MHLNLFTSYIGNFVELFTFFIRLVGQLFLFDVGLNFKNKWFLYPLKYFLLSSSFFFCISLLFCDLNCYFCVSSLYICDLMYVYVFVCLFLFLCCLFCDYLFIYLFIFKQRHDKTASFEKQDYTLKIPATLFKLASYACLLRRICPQTCQCTHTHTGHITV